MKFNAKAPLRLGLAGGGTDVSPYSDLYGGAIVNATIALYAHCTITTNATNTITIQAHHQPQVFTYDNSVELPIDGCLDLAKGVYNCLQRDFGFIHSGLDITTHVDAPVGSGLGTSSTLVVAILGAFVELLKLPFTKNDLANYAYKVERNYLQFAGGKQDQYAAVFGGINFMQFLPNDEVLVHKLTINQESINQLQNNLLLYFTQSTRDSSVIIKEQQQNVLEKKEDSIQAMHQLKKLALDMQLVFEKNTIDAIGKILNDGFLYKQQMAKNITNQFINSFYRAAINAGATGGKISGAGGGGFMFFYCPNNTKPKVTNALQQIGGNEKAYKFTNEGLNTWTEHI